MIHLDIRSHLNVPQLRPLMKKAALATLRAQAAGHSDLTIVLTDDEEIRALNRTFRDVDAPTDVLAFPAHETDPQTGYRYLGDIVVSWPRAVQQAAARNHPPEAEVQLLIVHGVLHLLGFDHDEAESQAHMWATQKEVLVHLGLDRLDMD